MVTWYHFFGSIVCFIDQKYIKEKRIAFIFIDFLMDVLPNEEATNNLFEAVYHHLLSTMMAIID